MIIRTRNGRSEQLNPRSDELIEQSGDFRNRDCSEKQPGNSDPPQETPHHRAAVRLALPERAFAEPQCFVQSRRKPAENIVDWSSPISVGSQRTDGSVRWQEQARQIASPRASAAALRIAEMLFL